MPGTPAHFPGYSWPGKPKFEDSHKSTEKKETEFSDMPLELKEVVYNELFPTDDMPVVREEGGRLKVTLKDLQSNAAGMCPSARYALWNKARNMRLVILEYEGSEAWSPATLCPELVVRSTLITQNMEAIQSVAIAKICIVVDMKHERIAAKNVRNQVGAKPRDRDSYLVTLVDGSSFSGWLETLAAYQFNELPNTFQGFTNQAGAASVPKFSMKVEFPEVGVNTDDNTRKMLEKEEEAVLNMIEIVRNPNNNVEIPERLLPDRRKEVLRHMNVLDSTVQEFMENVIAVGRARIEMLNDQFSCSARSQEQSSVFNPSMYLDFSRFWSELRWSMKRATGPLRDAIVPYEPEIEKQHILASFNAVACAYAKEGFFPEGTGCHLEGSQCQHEVCADEYFNYTSTKLEIANEPRSIPQYCWYAVLHQHVMLHQVHCVDDSEFEPLEVLNSLRGIKDQYALLEGAPLCTELAQDIELLQSAAAGNVQPSQEEEEEEEEQLQMSEVVFRCSSLMTSSPHLGYIQADSKDSTGVIKKGPVTFDRVKGDTDKGAKTLRLGLYKGRIAKCV
ncbi:hypothetical protein KC342_g9747 [Hortaea werneckii]|nr:hypothetical protein KC342_g9747 [Hortaea werneckii]KAI7400734.1 hypothetical protein KC328_g3436 [Hortaea werneckii]